jgi:3-deoxy-manno-octulosonate cytidylyltransferase (CMP-KDO synthetase)
MTKKIIGIIPARYKSSRFPGKPLVKLLGKPMIVWVAELASIALGKENIVIATDDFRIVKVVEDAGYQTIMTSQKHLTGTDRLVEVARKIKSDIYINIQGDEPTVDPNVILKVAEEKINNPNSIICAMAKLDSTEDPNNINIPKVIVNENMDLVYMSRLAIPGYKNKANKPQNYYKQVCVYAFNQDQLLSFGDFGRKSKLEECEDIEILRFLDLKTSIKMVKVEGISYAIDVKEDIDIVNNRLKEIHKK